MDQIIDRIKKLLKHADSAKSIGSLKEAETFAQKANELLLEYNLTMHQIAMSANEDEDEFAKWVYGEYISYQDKHLGDRWMFNLVRVLCKHNLCNVVFNKEVKKFKVYGLIQNVDTVIWLYNFLSTALFNIGQEKFYAFNKKEKKLFNRYQYLRNFCLGAVKGIDDKLAEQIAGNKHAEQIFGLIKYNAEALERFLKKVEPNSLKFKPKSISVVSSVYAQGYEVGRNININKPLAATKAESKLLSK
jgi:Protein of unknown function (DUF2786)